MEEIAKALSRASAILVARPGAGLHADAPGTARWRGGLSVETTHPSGLGLITDMPGELGGGGNHVSPGWMVRAGLAACLTTTIAMIAAFDEIVLDVLEVQVDSRSDTRGLLGVPDVDGQVVYPGPIELVVQVRIAAAGQSPERLAALVEQAQTRAPMTAALRDAQTLRVDLVVDGG